LVLFVFFPSHAQQDNTSIDYVDRDSNRVPDTIFLKEVKVYEFQHGDTIADIGAGSGYFEKVLSKYCDNLIVYATDIMPGVLMSLSAKLEELRLNDNKNIEYNTVLGQSKSTLLPFKTFDKVIIRNTFHHFSYPDEMLQNCREVLKDGGKLFIVDILVDETTGTPRCHGHLTRKKFLNYLTSNGYVLAKETDLHYDDFKCFEFHLAN
jgi:ubiquinone/menaquinone biosynthesis C-methylase UbiE